MKKILKKITPNFIKKIYRFIKKIYKFLKGVPFREIRKNFGKLNKDMTFYVIRRTPPAAGLMSNYGMVLIHLLEAEERNLIPIIDYENYDSFYKEKEEINGSNNAWEYYWKQPSNYKLSEIYKSNNVILSAEMPKQKKFWEPAFLWNDQYISKLHEISKKVPLNEIVEKYVTDIYNILIPKNKKIVGVAVRGTDYLSSKFHYGHPVQPTKKELINIVKEKVEEWNIDYVFLTTEEDAALEMFKNEFQDKLIFVDRVRCKSYKDDTKTPSIKFADRKNDKYLTGLEYLTEMIILSKCDFLIAASNSGVVAATILNGNKYEKKHIIDLGLYQ